MLGIVVSQEDRASEHVGEHLLDLADWRERTDDDRPDGDGGGTVFELPAGDGRAGTELRTFDDLHIYLEGCEDAFTDDVELIAFASRHSGDTGPLLTAHATGNVGPAEYGGEPDALARAAPNAAVRALAALDDYAPTGYDTGLECTHHGPTDLDAPSLFVEVGSGPEQWDDPDAARAVARAILDLRGVPADRERTLVGFGGNHYVPRFERVVRETDWAVGHVAVDWALDAIGDPADHRGVVRAVFERSAAGHALVDGDHPALERVVDDLGYRVVSETWVRETTDVPLDLAERLEARLRSVDDGLRFGALARGVPGHLPGDAATGEHPAADERSAADECAAADECVDPVATVDLPADLVEAVNGIDRGRAVAAARDHAVAFTTAESGTVLDGTLVLPSSADRTGDSTGHESGPRSAYDEVVEALAGVLRRKYDAVERERAGAAGAPGSDGVDGADESPYGVLVARRETFSPGRARALGVPEGPAFGRLANGDAVEVDGETIAPERVRDSETRRFALEPTVLDGPTE